MRGTLRSVRGSPNPAVPAAGGLGRWITWRYTRPKLMGKLEKLPSGCNSVEWRAHQLEIHLRPKIRGPPAAKYGNLRTAGPQIHAYRRSAFFLKEESRNASCSAQAERSRQDPWPRGPIRDICRAGSGRHRFRHTGPAGGDQHDPGPDRARRQQSARRAAQAGLAQDDRRPDTSESVGLRRRQRFGHCAGQGLLLGPTDGERWPDGLRHLPLSSRR